MVVWWLQGHLNIISRSNKLMCLMYSMGGYRRFALLRTWTKKCLSIVATMSWNWPYFIRKIKQVEFLLTAILNQNEFFATRRPRPANTIHWPNAALMLAHPSRCWPNMKPALGQRLFFCRVDFITGQWALCSLGLSLKCKYLILESFCDREVAKMSCCTP